jgi:hypothetical protein
MRTQLIAFLVATAVAAFGQTPDSAHTFYFAHTSTTQGMQEVRTSIATIAAMSEVSVDESKKSLTVHGTAEQNGLAEWMFTSMDVTAPAPSDTAIHEYRMHSGVDNVVRLFYLNRGQSIQEFQEFATLFRTLGDVRRVFTTNASKILAMRGNAEQAAMADWIINEVEKSAAEPRQHSVSAQYRFADPADREKADAIQVLYVGNAATVQSFQEIATSIRTITDIRRVYTYNTPRAIALRGTSDEIALAAWLFDLTDKPANAAPTPPSAIYNYQAVDPRNNSVQVFSLAHTATPADFQKIATQVRTETGIPRVFTYNAPRVMMLRGTTEQLVQAERLLKQLDPPDFPAGK